MVMVLVGPLVLSWLLGLGEECNTNIWREARSRSKGLTISNMLFATNMKDFVFIELSAY